MSELIEREDWRFELTRLMAFGEFEEALTPAANLVHNVNLWRTEFYPAEEVSLRVRRRTDVDAIEFIFLLEFVE